MSEKELKRCEIGATIYYLIIAPVFFLGAKVVILLFDIYTYFVDSIQEFWGIAENMIVISFPILIWFGIIVGLKKFLHNGFKDFKDFKVGMKEFITVEINYLKKWAKRIGTASIVMFVFCKLLKGVTFLLIYNKVVMI